MRKLFAIALSVAMLLTMCAVPALAEGDRITATGVGRGIDPFMTLSFMSLPVIPTLRLTTKGMVDVLTQQFV